MRMKKGFFIVLFLLASVFAFADEFTGVFEIPFNTERTVVLDKMSDTGFQIQYVNTIEDYDKFYKSSIPNLRFFKPKYKYFENPASEIVFTCENGVFTNAEITLDSTNNAALQKAINDFVKKNKLKKCKDVITDEYSTFSFIAKNGNIFAYVIQKDSNDIVLVFLCPAASDYNETLAAIQ